MISLVNNVPPFPPPQSAMGILGKGGGEGADNNNVRSPTNIKLGFATQDYQTVTESQQVI